MIDVVDNGDAGFARGAPLFRVDEVGDFEVEGQIGLVVLLWIDCVLWRRIESAIGSFDLWGRLVQCSRMYR